MTATPTPTIQPSNKLGDLVNRFPQLTPTLDRMQLDYCCGGHRSLAEACTAAGLDIGEAVDALRASASEPTDGLASMQQLVNMPPSELADHIVQTHHVYLRAELPRLNDLAARVMNVHGERHPELIDVRNTVTLLRDDLEPHLDRRVLAEADQRAAGELDQELAQVAVGLGRAGPALAGAGAFGIKHLDGIKNIPDVKVISLVSRNTRMS